MDNYSLQDSLYSQNKLATQWEHMPVLTRKMRNNSSENNFGSSNSGEPCPVSWPITEHGESGHNGLHSNLNSIFLEVILTQFNQTSRKSMCCMRI